MNRVLLSLAGFSRGLTSWVSNEIAACVRIGIRLSSECPHLLGSFYSLLDCFGANIYASLLLSNPLGSWGEGEGCADNGGMYK